MFLPVFRHFRIIESNANGWRKRVKWRKLEHKNVKLFIKKGSSYGHKKPYPANLFIKRSDVLN